MLKKVLKYLALLLLLLLFVVLGALVYIQNSKRAQRAILEKASAYINTNFGAQVSISNLSFENIQNIALKQVLISDHHQDTLLFANHITIKPCLKSYFSDFKIDEINLNDAQLNIVKYKNEAAYNISMLIEKFSSNSSQSNSEFEISRIKISSLNFLLHDHNISNAFLPLELKKMNISSSLKLHSNRQVDVLIEQLNGVHALSEIKQLSSKLTITKEHLKLTQSKLQTTSSSVLIKAFNYNFKTNEIKAQVSNSTLFLSEFFSSILKQETHPIELDNFTFKKKGNVLKVKNLNASSGLITKLNTSGELNLQSLDFNLYSVKLQSNKNEIEQHVQLINRILKKENTFILPKQTKNLGLINFNGRIQKTGSNVLALGKLNTALGQLDIENTFKYKHQYMALEGLFKTKAFDLGELLQINDLGKVSSDLQMHIEHDQKNSTALLKGVINGLDYRQYTYENILIDGQLSSEVFEGKASIDNKNVAAKFNGTYHFNDSVKTNHFKLDVDHANLKQLGFLTTDTAIVLKTKANIDVIGNNIDHLNGLFDFDEFVLQKNESILEIENLYIQASNSNDTPLSFELSSNLGAVKAKGSFSKQHIKHIKQLLLNPDKASSQDSLESFELTVDLKQTKPLSRFVFNHLAFENQLHAHLFFNQNQLLIESKIKDISYKSFDFKNIEADLSLPIHQNDGFIKIDHIAFEDRAISKNLISISSDQQNIQLNMLNQIKNDFLNYNITSLVQIDSNAVHVDLDKNSSISIFEKAYQCSGSALQALNHPHNLSSQFNIFSDQESADLKIQNEKDLLSYDMKFKNFSIAPINLLTGKYEIDLKGKINGRLSAKNSEVLQLQADAKISELYMNGIDLNILDIQSQFAPEKKGFDVTILLQESNLNESLYLTGSIYTDKRLDLQVKSKTFRLENLNPFTRNIVTIHKGFSQISASIQGSLNTPNIKGSISINDAEIEVDYLKTRYKLSQGNVQILPDMIYADHQTILDDQNQEALLNFTLLHQNFKNINFDVSLMSDQTFKVMQTLARDNNLFYGTAFVKDLNLDVSGYQNIINIEAQASSAENTIINFPISAQTYSSNAQFISFENSTSLSIDKKVLKKQKEDHVLNFELFLDVKDNAQSKIIFDEQIGDVIKTTGNGDLSIKYSSNEDLSILGDYTIKKGEYLFTFQNVINKKFKIKPGSSIEWTGNPYKGLLDIQAVYNLRTSLGTILTDVDQSNINRRIPVECVLSIEKELLNPQVGFQIDFPTLSEIDPQKAAINSILNSQDEIRNQFFSLLMLNRFMAPENSSLIAESRLGANSSSELLSNQLSNWVSKLSNDVDIGLNYRPGDEFVGDEIELELSTQLLNDRLTLEGNFGVSNSNGIDQQDQSQNSGLIGDVFIEYALNKEQNLSLKAYNKSNDFDLLQINNARYTQGVGIAYQKNFDKLKELFKNLFRKNEK